MKTCPNILTHNLTDTAPLAAHVQHLCLTMMAMLDRGLQGAAFKAGRAVRGAVREFCKADLANHQQALKLRMLGHKYWRRLVLKELGGPKALKRWVKAMARCAARRETMERTPPTEPKKSAWRKTPEVMAEELRQKAHAQKCAKACAPSGTFLDPCKLDSDGWFRLPPFPRLCGPRDPDVMWTTPFYMENYHYEALPTKYLTGANAPIMVWPAEFEAAELWDYERWLRVRTLGRWGEESVEDVVDEDVLRDAATAAPQDEAKAKTPAPTPSPQHEEKAKAPAPPPTPQPEEGAKAPALTPHPEEGANAPVSKDRDVSQDDVPQDEIMPTPPPAVLKASTLEQDDNHEAAN
ncbi:hypothetical protein N9W89_07530 [Hellea sp.]|nr:hypothetical protein [Hellea sp.]